jgi:cytoskeleton protein RodZ
LRHERIGRGISIDDISRDTRIASKFLEAIETDDFSYLPGLVFTRSFVRQYALALALDPDPLLAELPTEDESTIRLPDPPARPPSSYQRDRTIRSALSSIAWLLLAGGAGIAVYVYLNHSTERQLSATKAPATAPQAGIQAKAPPAKEEGVPVTTASPRVAPSLVQVTLTAHAAAWVQVSTDGKTAFTGTLMSNETKEVSATEQVKILTGNAGALTISLNGKTLESIGPIGQVREVKLTAEGPQFLPKDPPPVPDPL